MRLATFLPPGATAPVAGEIRGDEAIAFARQLAADTGIPMTAFVLDAPSVTLALERAGVALFDGPERAVVGYATRTRR